MPRSARSVTQTSVPLGSLTQRGARGNVRCGVCDSVRVTKISMNLTDGSPVEFVSCHSCEHRTWNEAGGGAAVPVARVLDRARKRT
jgi:hypothetical protein